MPLPDFGLEKNSVRLPEKTSQDVIWKLPETDWLGGHNRANKRSGNIKRRGCKETLKRVKLSTEITSLDRLCAALEATVKVNDTSARKIPPCKFFVYSIS